MTGLLTGCGVLAIAAVLAHLWHRWFEPVPQRYRALYLAILLILFFRPLFFERWFQIPSMGEIARKLYPFKPEIAPKPIQDNFLLADVATQIYPWYRLAREQILSGRFPLYNPTAACGMPLMENAQSSVFTLPAILSFLFPPLDGLTVMVFLNLFLLLLFMHSYLAQLKLSRHACAFGSLAFAFSGFAMAWLYFPILRILPYWPLTFFCLEKLRNGPSRRFTLLLAFALAETVVAGNPESAMIYILFGSAYFLFRLPSAQGRRRFLGAFIAAALLATALSAFFWIPFLDYLPHSTRFNLVRLLAPRHNASVEFKPDELATFVFPLYYGLPSGTEKQLGPNSFNEMAGYAGLFSLFFCFWAWRTKGRSPTLFFWVSLGIVLLILVRFHPLLVLLRALPLLKYASLERFRVLATFCLAVLGAIGLDRVLSSGRLNILRGIFFGAALIPLMIFSPVVRLPLKSALPLFFAGYLLFILFLLLHLLKAPLVPALLACMLADLLLPMRGFNPVLPADASVRPTPAVRFLQDRSIAADSRMVAEGIQLPPNLSALFQLEDVRFNDPMTPWNYWAFVYYLKLANNRYWPVWTAFEGGALDFLGVRHVLKVPQFPMPDHPLVYHGPDGLIYENVTALNKFFVPARVRSAATKEEVWRLLPTLDLRTEACLEGVNAFSGNNTGQILSIKKHSPVHYTLKLRGERSFILCSSITTLRPWIGTVDGRILPKVVVNGNFLGFAVPPGETELQVRYHPRLFYWGLVLGLIGLLVSMLAAFVGQGPGRGVARSGGEEWRILSPGVALHHPQDDGQKPESRGALPITLGGNAQNHLREGGISADDKADDAEDD